MGLDMYLNKRKYLGWNFSHRREGHNIPDLSEFGIDSSKVSMIEEEVCYWRKANHIHKWFVDNVQDGDDDCSKKSDVSKEDLTELLRLVKLELEAKDDDEVGNPGDFLPTQSGFFFGNTEYNEYYYQDLEDTRQMLCEILANWDNDADYYYQSSW